MNKKFVLIVFFLISAAFTASCGKSTENNTDNSITVVQDKDGIRPDSVAFGIYTLNKDYIDNGSTLNNKIAEKHIIEIGQNRKDKIDYILLAFADYKQINFVIGKEEYRKFSFDLDENQVKDITIEHKNLSSCHELTYLIIPDFDKKVEKDNMEQALNWSSVYSMRFILEGGTVKTANKYNESDKNKTTLDSIFLSDTADKLKVLTTVSKETPLYLHIADSDTEVQDYLFLALNDWEQVPISNESLYLYFENIAGYEWLQTIDISTMKTNSNFQIIGIPNPFRNFDFYTNKTAYYTHRINIID